MAGKQAKILSDRHLRYLLTYVGATRYPDRNRIIVLLSVKAGLRAGEIAGLTWNMVLGPSGEVGTTIELHDKAAKKSSGRRVPVHPDLRTALVAWKQKTVGEGPVVRSDRGGPMTATSIRELVRPGIPTAAPQGLLFPLGSAHVHHSGCAAGAPSWRLAARCPVACRPSVDRNDRAVYRRRHRCATLIGVDVMMFKALMCRFQLDDCGTD